MVICILILAGCEQNASNTQVNETEISDLNASLFDQGRDILYNANTRFEYSQAISILENIVSTSPDNAEAHFELIYAYLKQEKYTEAGPVLSALVPMRDKLSDKSNLWLNALSHKINDDNAAEIEAWKKATQSYPNDRWGFYELSIAYSIFENYAQAATAAQRALTLEPSADKWGATWIYYLHSKSLYRSGQYEKAISAASDGRENATSWRSTFFRMKLGEIRHGNLTDVNTAIDEYIAISNSEGRNNLTYTHANIALFYFELGDYENAVKYARLSYDADPSAYQTWTLGCSMIENGNPQEAIAILEKGSIDFSTDAMTHLAKGWAYYRLGRLEEARVAILAAQTTSPRKSFTIEKSLKFVNDAIISSDAPSAPPVPWLG